MKYIPVSRLFNLLRTFLWFYNKCSPFLLPEGIWDQGKSLPIRVQGRRAGAASDIQQSCTAQWELLTSPSATVGCAVQATGCPRGSRRLVRISHKNLHVQWNSKEAQALPHSSHMYGQNSCCPGKWEQQHFTMWKHSLILDGILVSIIKRETLITRLASSKNSALFFPALCIMSTVPETLPSVFLGDFCRGLERLMVYSEVRGCCLFCALWTSGIRLSSSFARGSLRSGEDPANASWEG